MNSFKNMKIQLKSPKRASVYRTNRLFEQFRLHKNDSMFFLINSSLIRTGTPLIRAVRRVAAP